MLGFSLLGAIDVNKNVRHNVSAVILILQLNVTEKISKKYLPVLFSQIFPLTIWGNLRIINSLFTYVCVSKFPVSARFCRHAIFFVICISKHNPTTVSVGFIEGRSLSPSLLSHLAE